MVDHAYPFSVSWTSDGLKDYRKKVFQAGTASRHQKWIFG